MREMERPSFKKLISSEKDEKQQLLQEMQNNFISAGITQDEITKGIQWISKQDIRSIRSYLSIMKRKPELIKSMEMKNYMLVPYIDSATPIQDSRKDEIEKQYEGIKRSEWCFQLEVHKERMAEAAYTLEITMLTLGYKFEEVVN